MNRVVTAPNRGHFEFKAAFTGAEEVRTSYEQVDYGQSFASIDFATTLNGVKIEASDRIYVLITPARIALDSSKATGAYATRGKIRGTVTWKAADGTWEPVPAGSRVFGGTMGEMTTDSAGRFTGTPTFLNDGTWTVSETSEWLTASARSVTVDTTAGTRFSHHTASVDSKKTVYVCSALERFEIPAGATSLKVEVQHSVDGKTGWTTRKSVDVDVPTEPGTNREAFVSTTLPYPGSAYIRLRYAGTKAIHGWTNPGDQGRPDHDRHPAVQRLAQTGQEGPAAHRHRQAQPLRPDLSPSAARSSTTTSGPPDRTPGSSWATPRAR
ncbi:hypothetical protein ACE1OC_00290 [Streptomyces sp. DSM 116496]|uniref:hypothetical protein n=1 Tax=Streptomyces stoeckheimensis TaxID=3344656 RepID=UPI0038B2F6AF